MNAALNVVRRGRDIIRLARYLARSDDLKSERLDLGRAFIVSRLQSPASDDTHLREAINWLCLAQDSCADGGVSAAYHLGHGWDVAYPETSGYIIATLLAYADFAGGQSYLARAREIGEWEMRIQAPNGGVFSSLRRQQTRVFNTGQVVLGWCALHDRTGDTRYLEAGARAGRYLVALQEPDGSWSADTHCGARTYHARVDWALIRLGMLTGENRFIDAATRNLRWVLDQQLANGWFENAGFHDDDPITHVIGYTLRGLIECHATGIDLGLDLLPRAVGAADHLCKAITEHPVRGIPGMVPASFDRHWQSRDDHSCLTGNAQVALTLYRLGKLTGEKKYPNVADSVMAILKRTQNVASEVKQIRGAIPGSYPIYSGYMRNSYPNWATKFFADALLMQRHWREQYNIVA